MKIYWKHENKIGNKKRYIGNIVMRLETKNADWKHKKLIGNKKSRLKTKKDIENNLLRLET